jgi:tetratricopeptide (TPR) repeat protein
MYPPATKSKPTNARKSSSTVSLGLLLAVVTVVAYLPALSGGFIWDDGDHIANNLAIRSLDGLRAIWFQPGATLQYYPLTFSLWWLAYHLWGLNPLGYHLLTLLLHLCAALLFWQVLVRLNVRGAWLAAAIFALHPVNVMSVAWMTELKNTLSATLALGSAWAYLRFAGLGLYTTGDNVVGRSGASTLQSKENVWRWYVLALAIFGLAMLAKTAVSFLPVSLLIITWWQRKRLNWRAVWPVLPMLGLVLIMGAITIHVELQSGAVGEKFTLSFVDRVLISGRSFWFYLGKLFFPYPQSFIYERWAVNASVWWQYLYPVATVALFAGLWFWRGRIGLGPFVAFLHFYVSTSFLILVVVLFMTQYSFVSDHWQYFGCMSVIALLAAGITRLFDRFTDPKSLSKPVLGAALLLTLGIVTWQQTHKYHDPETLMRDTLAKNPSCWMARNNLGNVLLNKGQYDQAISQFQEAIRLKADFAEAHSNLGIALFDQGQTDAAISQFQEAIRLDPDYAKAYNNLGIAFAMRNQIDKAIRQFREANRINPYTPKLTTTSASPFSPKGKPTRRSANFRRPSASKLISGRPNITSLGRSQRRMVQRADDLQMMSAVTTNRPARVESNQPANVRKYAFSFQKTPRNALLWSFLELKCSFRLCKMSGWFNSTFRGWF